MHILIITPYYTPDLGPDAPMFEMLSTGLVRRGHQVTVITEVPHYPTGRVPPAFQGKWIQRTFEKGVEVIRVAIPSLDRTNLNKRLLQFICFQIGAVWASLGLKYDVALVINPALETWLPFVWSAIFRLKPTIYSVYDVYPDVGIKLGIFKYKLQISAVTWLERFCLIHSPIVQIISNSFRPGLHALGIPDSKIDLVDIWVDTELINPLPHDNTFTHEYGLTNRFIVLYAGNIGLSQGLDHVLAAAGLLADQLDLLFVFVGDGSGLKSLQVQAEQQKLSNVQFIPFQPRERLPEVLASANVSLVIQRCGFGTDSLPSKIFSIMASGRPLLISVDEQSETWKLVEKAKAGIWAPPENPSKLAESLLYLKRNQPLCDKLGFNGRYWVEQHHSPQSATIKFEKLLLKAIASQNLSITPDRL